MRGFAIRGPRFAACLIAALVATGCEDPVVIKRLAITPAFVCSGDSIHFDWHIKHVDSLEIRTASGQRLYRTTQRQGTWDSPPAQAGWDYLSLIGCQDGDCQTHFYDVQLIDNPKWTCGYFDDLQSENSNVCGDMNGDGRFEIVGGPPETDYLNPLPSQSRDGSYAVHRIVDGYRYNIPRAHFSARARVVQVKYDGILSAVLGLPDRILNPDGMSVEALGPSNAFARTWVPNGQSYSVGSTFHPTDTTWQLSYRNPERVAVGQQYGGPPEPGQKADISSTPVGQFPAIVFQVKCDTSSPTP